MQPGQTVTICSYSGRQWKDAEIVERGIDTLTGQSPTVIVRHPHFHGNLAFYADADSEGKHRNVGNAAFWIEE